MMRRVRDGKPRPSRAPLVCVMAEASVTKKELVELCRRGSALGTSRAFRVGRGPQGRRQLTTCAARLRERVKRGAQFTFCAGCYETVVLRAL